MGQGAIAQKKNSRQQTIAITITALLIGFITIKIFGGLIAGQTELPTDSAWFIMLVCLIAGEVVSAKTNAFVPGMFVSSVLAIAGFWTVVPKDIMRMGHIPSELTQFFVLIIIVHMGSMLNLQELVAQWRTVLITLAGMFGICVAVLTIGRVFLGLETAAIATPPLTGGFVAALMMQNTATAMGNSYLATLSIAIYILQGFAGFPLTSLCLKQEGRKLLARYHKGEITLEDLKKQSKSDAQQKEKLLPPMPEKYNSSAMTIFKIMIVVILSGYLEALTNGIISKFVIALILGVVASEVGFIEPKPLETSKSMGMIMIMIMLGVFSNLSVVTVDMLFFILRDFALLIVLSVLGIAAISIPLGRSLGWSIPMSFGIGLSSLAGGFPASYVLSVEAARMLAKDQEEYELLETHFLPKTLVAGFISATSGSVFVAGVVISMFF